RVCAAGLPYGGGRFYSNGVFRGRRAMLSLTTGGPAAMYSPRGLNGDIDMLLYPINHGILHFVGFDVLPPFVAYAVTRSSPDQRRAALRDFAQRLRTWETATPLIFHPLDDYDETLQLKADKQPRMAGPVSSLPAQGVEHEDRCHRRGKRGRDTGQALGQGGARSRLRRPRPGRCQAVRSSPGERAQRPGGIGARSRA